MSVTIGSGSRQLLMVGNFLSESASRSATEDLAIHLVAQGWRVRMTSSKRQKAARILDMLHTTWRSRNVCAAALVDLYSGPAFLWALLICLLWRITARKPYFLTLHGGNLPLFSARWPRTMRMLLDSASAVTAPSRYLLEHMASYRSDMHLIPNGVDLSLHTLTPRRTLAPHLVWVRSFHETYNPRLAVNVLAKLAPAFPDATLTMVGPDKGDGSLQATADTAVRFGLRDRVRLVGRVDKSEVPAWLDQATVFLNTTNVDNAPVSVVEAMASGLCVVSTNVGGLSYLLDDGRNALLVPPNDATAMANAVRRLLDDPAYAARLSTSAVETARQFDWSVVMPKWNQLLAATVAVPQRAPEMTLVGE